MSTTFDLIVTKIIKEQELIIGPIAWQEAEHVLGIILDDHTAAQVATENPKEIVDQLVGRYERLFGRASREVCKDAVKTLLADLAPSDIPSTLTTV